MSHPENDKVGSGLEVVAEAYLHRSRDSLPVTVINIRQIGRLRDGDKLVCQSDAERALSERDAEIQRQREQLEHVTWLLRELRDILATWRDEGFGDVWVERIDAALSRQAEPVEPAPAQDEQQPVAWRWMYNGESDGPYAFNYPLPDDDVVRRGLMAARPRTVQPLYAAPIEQTTPKPEQSGLVDALTQLLCWAEKQVCTHEDTHRGGAIWEICDSCGAKWANDEGGRPEFEWPKEIKAARAALSASPGCEVVTEFIKSVSKSRYGSPAKMYGRVTIGDNTFLYHKPTDTLVRADLYNSYKESLK